MVRGQNVHLLLHAPVVCLSDILSYADEEKSPSS